MSFCNECSVPMVKKHCDIITMKQEIGEFTTKSVIHNACELCGDKVVMPDEAERIELNGFKIHLLQILSNTGSQSVLTLRDLMHCPIDIITKVAGELHENKKVRLSDNSRFPKICLIDDSTVFEKEQIPYLVRLFKKIFISNK